MLEEVDLAVLGAAVLDWGDATAGAAVKRVLAADVLVLSSPTYKGSYSGLLKAFLDRVGGGALAGAAAIPILLGGAPNHTLAVNVHFAPLLVELGAVVPGGLFVLESDVDAFPAFAAGWVAERRRCWPGRSPRTGPPSPPSPRWPPRRRLSWPGAEPPPALVAGRVCLRGPATPAGQIPVAGSEPRAQTQFGPGHRVLSASDPSAACSNQDLTRAGARAFPLRDPGCLARDRDLGAGPRAGIQQQDPGAGPGAGPRPSGRPGRIV